MRQRWTIPTFLCLTGILAGCQRISEADQQAAIDCVKANMAAMQRTDIDGVMATIHPKSPNYEPTRDVVASIKRAYKLNFELEKVEIERASTNGILVRFVQVVRKVDGPDDSELEDSRTKGTHLLQRDGKAWKIWSTQVQSSELIPALTPTPTPAPPVKPAAPAPETAPATPAAPAPAPAGQ